MINNIKNNTISESDPKKKINELNEIKKLEKKGRRLIKSQKTLLSLFDDLKTIFNNNNNNNNNESNNKNENLIIIIIIIMKVIIKMKIKMKIKM